MSYFIKASILAVTLGLGACASADMGESHHRGVEASATAEREGEEAEHDMECPMMAMMTPLMGCHGEAGDVDARLAGIRAALAITPEQESVWSAYADAYRAHAGQMAAMMGGGRSESAAPPPIPERFQRNDAMMARQMSAMRPMRAAVESLYATLSDAQKANADALMCDER